MRPNPTQKISTNALKVWRITGLLETLLYSIIPVGYFFLNHFLQFPLWLFWCLLGAILIVGMVKIMIIPTLKWRSWRYEVYENEVDLRFGIVVVRRVLIPMIRVQHVDTRQGPLLRRFGLATLTITTAATVHQIPALTEGRAASLRDQISKLTTEADEDV
ncbi:PH domain-containing protein [Anaerobacillus sp. CMMVII]|uniref:PH domain-containing protein n=1 Tax=Anaerobacillus sp. CMMVII TaxID=2755588 RepID=UPI0021B6F2CF|nr:PH domain-containing protein [Anaerobacillus sp. CMMVII]MCT8138948.1 PH domain-containing protein [Anaerobacillus sp. CMMVII]